MLKNSQFSVEKSLCEALFLASEPSLFKTRFITAISIGLCLNKKSNIHL